jgi:hypothetical protein
LTAGPLPIVYPFRSAALQADSRHFGDAREGTIARSIETLSPCYFAGCATILRVMFGYDCRLACISRGAFLECRSLSSICIPSSVRHLGDHCLESGSHVSMRHSMTFLNCVALASMRIPSSVTRVCTRCLVGCQYLSTATFESGWKVFAIEGDAFYMCGSLRSLFIPSSPAARCPDSFFGCH